MTVAYLTDHPRYAGTSRLDHLDRIRLSVVAGILAHGTPEQRQTLRDYLDDQPLSGLLQSLEVAHG